VASQEEMEFIHALSESAALSPEQQEAVRKAATDITEEELRKCLDVLKGSDLRFSLVTDLIAFAESDKNYSPEEKANIEKIAQYLNINQKQFSLLNQFVKKSSAASVSPSQTTSQGFLGSLGLEDKFKSAGINIGSLTKGLLGFAGPMILAGLVNRGLRRTTGGGGLGGFGGGSGGGLGSIISMLNGGRGFGSTGGLLSKILKGF
jgi:uncharacterized tellurite resistance protein B-like protein